MGKGDWRLLPGPLWPSDLDIDFVGMGVKGGYDKLPGPPPPQDRVKPAPPPPPPPQDKKK